MTKITIKDVQRIALDRGGHCLSKKFHNSHSLLKWKCIHGHTWSASFTSIKHNLTWCPYCSGNATQSIKDMHEIAQSKGGKCLSKVYKNSHSNLKWQCASGHIWEAKPVFVKRKTWCPYCVGKAKLTLTDMKFLAKERGGKCLSKEFIDSQHKLEWQCADGHIWEAKPNHIKNSDSWCPYCAKVAKLNIEDMNKIAQKHNGYCLSDKYYNANTNILWKCSNGHTWEARPGSIKSGSWCPYCGNNYVNENLSREIFEKIFNKKFPKLKPNWLINDAGNKMELDGLNIQLGVAFEYQGEQHYTHSIFFHKKDKNSLQKRIKDDLKKKITCKENGIFVIEIPYLIKTEELYIYIIKKLKEFNIKIPEHKPVNVQELRSSYSRQEISDFNKIARKNGGEFLSEVYLGTNQKHLWRCALGHTWKATPSSIKRGSWCRSCAKLSPLTIEEMRELALKREGKCLSKEYVNALTKLEWQCANGHVWKAVPASIKRGVWCPYCVGKAKLTLTDMKFLAKERGGKCLSKEYVNNKTKLKWQCINKHVWEANAHNIKNGTWCPVCNT